MAFLDEIFKANSSILNTLLTILNERQFDNGAGNRVACPLKCVIGASNELPESEELDALLDRFLLRAHVQPVSDDGLLQILSQTNHATSTRPDINVSDDLERVIDKISLKADKVVLGSDICLLLQKLRSFARDDLGMYISDRRLVKASRLLRVGAATHGRSKVDLLDCLLLEHVIWQQPDQQATIREWLLDNVTPNDDVIEQSKFLLRGLTSEASSLIKKTSGDVTGVGGARSSDLKAIDSVGREIKQIQDLLHKHSQDLKRHTSLIENLQDYLWVSRDSAYSAKQYLSPLASAASKEANNVLLNACSIQIALSAGIESDLRSSLLEMLIEDEDGALFFTEDELKMNLKEAKRKYDGDTLRKWKSARRKAVIMDG